MIISLFSIAVVEMSVGCQQIKLGERGGRRRDFNDTGVNTRQAIEHVKDSKSGWLKSNFLLIIPCMLIILTLTFYLCFVFFSRNKRHCHSIDRKLLSYCVPPSVGSVSVSRGLSTSNRVAAFAMCSALSA